MDNPTNHSGWLEFVEELQTDIFPVYEKHEQHFDGYGIHGRMHISRALMFAEVMGRLYLKKGQPVDMRAVRIAVAFHDSGRQGNGPDMWESESAALCKTYLNKKEEPDYASFISNLIIKTGQGWDVHKRVMHDADVLEIMRPCCGHGGFSGFKQNVLRFAGDRDPLAALFTDSAAIRKQLIEEAWEWIEETENVKNKLSKSKQYLTELLVLFQQRSNQYPLLSIILREN